MKQLIISVVFALLLGSAFSQDVILWDPATKLTWADFLGRADKESRFNAVTVSGIYFKINLGPTGFGDSIVAVFYKDDSWVKNPNDVQLAHEQGHFDITEIFARKLRKLRMEFIPRRGDPEYQLKQLYDEVDRKRDVMEKEYDRETSHSANPVAQRQWNERIRRELAQLERYAY